MKKLLIFTLLLAVALSLFAAPNPYFSGTGGQGTSLAILTPEGKNLAATEAYLPTLIQGVFVGDLSKFSAISVLDRQSLEKVLTETESGIYKSAEDYSHLGEIANVGYVLTGTLTKTASGFALQVQITDTASAVTKASYSGVCTAGDLDNFTGIKKASLDLLAQMGVELTAKGKEELTGAGAQQAINGETALAKGITAQKSGTVVETLAYYFQAAAIDPSLTEAVSRASVISADISSGNIGENVRNDIAWRDAWVARLTEAENFFRDYIKTPPPYDLVYSTDIQTGATNYTDRTVALSFEIELHPPSLEWFDTMAKVVQTVQEGLRATGRSEVWGFTEEKTTVTDDIWEGVRSYSYIVLNWPGKLVSLGADPFIGQNNAFTIVAALVNEKGESLGRQSINLAYGRNFVSSPKAGVSGTVTFPAVKADLITDTLTIKIVSVDGVAAETAGRDGHIRITTKAEYDKLPRVIAAEEARAVCFGFKDGTIISWNSNDWVGDRHNVFIPSTINGVAVTAIRSGSFEDSGLYSVTIPKSVTSIGSRAFSDYYGLTTITIGANVRLAGNEYGSVVGTESFPFKDFDRIYFFNHKKAGTYTLIDDTKNHWSYNGSEVIITNQGIQQQTRRFF
jgi:TolB-like protein